jgi:hypothetical protein
MKGILVFTSFIHSLCILKINKNIRKFCQILKKDYTIIIKNLNLKFNSKSEKWFYLNGYWNLRTRFLRYF